MATGLDDPDRPFGVSAPRPQTLLLTLLGRHVQHRPEVAVASSTFLAVLARLGVTHQAARSTLARMVDRGFLTRHRVGRQSYLSLTGRTRRLFAEGESRIFRDPVPPDTGQWTLLTFTIPEDQRADRYSLRAALAWRGFGALRNGLWIAPGRVDTDDLIEALGIQGRTDAFLASPLPSTDMASAVSEAWDLDEVRQGYEGFVDRWSGDATPEVQGPLAAQILLITEWRLLLVDDPGLPRRYLPKGWPAAEAFEVFQRRHHALSHDAAVEFESLLDAVAVEPAPLAGSGQ